jgi:K+-sensing histidine kinase KdpD
MLPSVIDSDERRVAALRQYGVLGRPPRSDLQALVDLAALVCDVPMATINLITDSEQHQVAAVGFDASVCRREDSMCAVTIGLDGPVVVPDASADDRFRTNPFVTGEIGDVRFYAAHQLRTPDDTVIGTLCVFDTVPRELSDDQRHALQTLAERVVDVLELSLVSQRYAAANERLAASNERLAAFAGQVSHDLKNPLTAITMSLEMVIDEADEVPGAQDLVPLLQRASRGAGRMQTMIGELLAFARGGAAPEVRPVDLGAVVEAVREDLGATAAASVEVPEPLPTVTADPVQLSAVLQNLVANGLKFRRDGVEPCVRVTADRRDGHWVVEVADNGRGVPDEHKARVFEPFERLDRSVPGTGIGLATCRRTVEAHGGRIGLRDAPGGGTVVWFELPA